MTPDERRVADEIDRCEKLTEAVDHDGDGLGSEHAYYRARASLLGKATTEEAIRFLREEMLDALKGGVGAGPAATPRTDRWLRLVELDYLNKRRIVVMERRMRRVMNASGLAAIDAAPGVTPEKEE